MRGSWPHIVILDLGFSRIVKKRGKKEGSLFCLAPIFMGFVLFRIAKLCDINTGGWFSSDLAGCSTRIDSITTGDPLSLSPYPDTAERSRRPSVYEQPETETRVANTKQFIRFPEAKKISVAHGVVFLLARPIRDENPATGQLAFGREIKWSKRNEGEKEMREFGQRLRASEKLPSTACQKIETLVWKEKINGPRWINDNLKNWRMGNIYWRGICRKKVLVSRNILINLWAEIFLVDDSSRHPIRYKISLNVLPLCPFQIFLPRHFAPYWIWGIISQAIMQYADVVISSSPFFRFSSIFLFTSYVLYGQNNRCQFLH